MVQSTPEEERKLVGQALQGIRDEYKEKMRAAMLQKLEENRGKAHWREAHLYFLLEELRSEVDELERLTIEPLLPGEDPWKEAADIANFAAMVADRLQTSHDVETLE